MFEFLVSLYEQRALAGSFTISRPVLRKLKIINVCMTTRAIPHNVSSERYLESMPKPVENWRSIACQTRDDTRFHMSRNISMQDSRPSVCVTSCLHIQFIQKKSARISQRIEIESIYRGPMTLVRRVSDHTAAACIFGGEVGLSTSTRLRSR